MHEMIDAVADLAEMIDAVADSAEIQTKDSDLLHQPINRNNDSQDAFIDLTLLRIHYNNVRCITNKRNLCMKMDLSVYKLLCFIET